MSVNRTCKQAKDNQDISGLARTHPCPTTGIHLRFRPGSYTRSTPSGYIPKTEPRGLRQQEYARGTLQATKQAFLAIHGDDPRQHSSIDASRCATTTFFPHDDNQQLSLSYSSTASRVVTGGQLNPTPWTIDRDQHQQTTKQGIDLKPYHEAEDGSVSMRPQFNHSRQKSNIRSLCTNHRMATSQ